MSIIYKIFNPLRHIAPITIKFKILLQKVTRAGLEWDDPLQSELAKEAGTALEEMVLMEDVTYPERADHRRSLAHVTRTTAQ